MAENTKIEWTDHSWSPWRGCTKVSEGCAHCYAETLADRFGETWGNWGKGKPRVKAKNWHEPRKWNRAACAQHHILQCEECPRLRIFPSLCDWLDEEVPIEWLAEFLQLIHETPHLDWLLLTKRPELFQPRLKSAMKWLESQCHVSVELEDKAAPVWHWLNNWIQAGNDGERPLNVWIGTSVENQRTADLRIPELLKIPAKVRFLSLEPLLGLVDLCNVAVPRDHDSLRRPWDIDGYKFNALTEHDEDRFHQAPATISWLIIGGESGNDARPCNVDWIRSLVQQGQSDGVPVFVKQLGATPIIREKELWQREGQPEEWQPGEKYVAMRQHHPKGGDPAEWPEDLRVRQFPSRN